MTAARYDLIIDQGSDFSLELTVKENGTLKDLSGWHGRASLRKSLEGDEIQKNSASVFTVNTYVGTDSSDTDTYGIQHVDNRGKLKLDMHFDTSDDIPAGTYYYDLEIYNNGGGNPATAPTQVKRLIGGSATIRREITR